MLNVFEKHRRKNDRFAWPTSVTRGGHYSRSNHDSTNGIRNVFSMVDVPSSSPETTDIDIGDEIMSAEYRRR